MRRAGRALQRKSVCGRSGSGVAPVEFKFEPGLPVAEKGETPEGGVGGIAGGFAGLKALGEGGALQAAEDELGAEHMGSESAKDVRHGESLKGRTGAANAK